MQLPRFLQSVIFLTASTVPSWSSFVGNTCSSSSFPVLLLRKSSTSATAAAAAYSSFLTTTATKSRTTTSSASFGTLANSSLKHLQPARFSTFPSSTTSTTTARSLSSPNTHSNDNNTIMNGDDDTQQEPQEDHLIFGKFKISTSQIFYKSPSDLTAAIVNLRPIVPGHVLVIPKRIVEKLSDLTNEEYDDLWRSVRVVQNVLEMHYNAGGFNVSVQDGKVAGQSVPHVHVHILPRKKGDFERNDDVYDKLEEWAPTLELSQDKKKNQVELDVPEDEDRKDRTLEMMKNESLLYRALLGTEANI
jgi:Diadenosine tetraphosphate (Ap4A) hydrolase and other HIT family hydrolases